MNTCKAGLRKVLTVCITSSVVMSPEDMADGANVLLRTVLAIDGGTLD